MNQTKNFPSLLYLLLCALFMCLFLTACGGPSDEKIAQAQQKYTELATIHNEVAKAHKNVSDGSLDETLTLLKEKVSVIEDYNLQIMKDDEIDLLIQTMDSIISSYRDCLDTLTEIKSTEDAAVLVSIPVTIINGSGLTFESLFLYEEKSSGRTNILENLNVFSPEQTLTGLLINRNVSNTPWLLTLTDSEGAEFEIVLPVAEYTEEGVCLTLTYDSETKELSLK